ncbi:2-octaprenyl-6-methoxyphenyl hydroxylase [Lysobacter capsici]|uniref:2-octaprenyl-6-methoxyphenyl hydroxylase n=1 Tax=Lysobacter capsici TaxID=435897 RepID=UPI001BFFEBFC|nr:2-octaprenyl-6-methoxyphenyl hydroxylase [Lysobacter capsici]QWF15877.1 2-octaprenyl-6-methoxyphenyl hydroxylase [Lysobacter capsici]QWF15897.1 2-octaprenyl-6-methoxyphenyl hydroxylase [Lysobacter capsici]
MPSTPAPHASHDVLIVGGGLVGASLAIALDRLGLDVGLIEAAPPGALPAVFDERNLSFAEATLNALNALGVMAKLRAPTGSIRRIHISRRGDFGRTVLDAQRYGREEFGRIVVARDFGEALEARLAELPRLHRYRPVRFVGLADETCTRDAGSLDQTQARDGDDASRRGVGAGAGAGSEWRAIRVADGAGERVLRARLLVAADGTRSGVRDALGIAADEYDYGQTLFVTRVRSERAPDGTAYERLGDDGPTALLPRGDRHYGFIHGVANDEAAAVAALDEAGFLARAQDAFGWRAGRFVACGARSLYPAIRVLAARTVAPRAVLVGNAAQTIHPIGAQGFNLGLRDAMTLAELIEHDLAASADKADCGSADLLERYARRRQPDRDSTIEFSDGLARLGSNETALMRPLRSLGLFALDRLPTAQSLLVGGAMGYRGDVPALCRGGEPALRGGRA